MTDTAWIITELQQRHRTFATAVCALAPDRMEHSRNGKWSPAQHLAHILKSVRPVALVLLVPRWFLRWRFGRLNRPARSYPELVERYRTRLATGGKASSPYAPPPIAAAAVPGIAAGVERTVARLCRRLRGWSDAELDTVLLPHPLLGKVTVREMLYFTMHHVVHHQALVAADGPPA